MLKWIHQNIPSRSLAHVFVKICHFAPYFSSILHQRNANLFVPTYHVPFGPWDYVRKKCTMSPICIVIVAIKMVWKCEKKKHVIIFNHIQRCSDIIYHSSLCPEFHCSIFLQYAIVPQRTMFHFIPGKTFQHNALCQLHYRLLLDQKGVKICKRGK